MGLDMYLARRRDGSENDELAARDLEITTTIDDVLLPKSIDALLVSTGTNCPSRLELVFL